MMMMATRKLFYATFHDFRNNLLDRKSSVNIDIQSLLFSIYFSLFTGGIVLIVFEISRKVKSIYLVRLKKKFINSKRVPPMPPGFAYSHY